MIDDVNILTLALVVFSKDNRLIIYPNIDDEAIHLATCPDFSSARPFAGLGDFFDVLDKFALPLFFIWGNRIVTGSPSTLYPFGTPIIINSNEFDEFIPFGTDVVNDGLSNLQMFLLCSEHLMRQRPKETIAYLKLETYLRKLTVSCSCNLPSPGTWNNCKPASWRPGQIASREARDEREPREVLEGRVNAGMMRIMIIKGSLEWRDY